VEDCALKAAEIVMHRECQEFQQVGAR